MTPTTNFIAFSGMRPNGCRTRTPAITTRANAANAPAAAAASAALDADPTVTTMIATSSPSRNHGGCPSDSATLQSVCYLLRTGSY